MLDELKRKFQQFEDVTALVDVSTRICSCEQSRHPAYRSVGQDLDSG